MALSMKANMFGIQEKPLLAMLRRHESAYVVPSGYSEDVVFVRTPFCVYRTFKTEELLKRYPLSEFPDNIKGTQQGWALFEAAAVTARLHATNLLAELDSGHLCRKLVAGEQSAWFERQYLDVFSGDASGLSDFLLESVAYHERPFAHSPLRISRQAGNTCGYVMPVVAMMRTY